MPEESMLKNPTKDKKINKNNIQIFFNIIEFFLIASITVLFYVNIHTSSNKVIFIPKGSTNSIIAYLNKSGFELNLLDSIIVRILGYPQQGWIDLKTTNLTKADFLYKLVSSKAALKTVTLIPGETAYFFLKDIAQKMNLSEEKLFLEYKKQVYKADGNILAESYSLPMGMSEADLIYYLLSYTNRQYEKFSKKIFGEYNRQNWYNYISIASIIQKEAASVEEMPLVSSVIYNRLNKGMPLQMDGTLNYGRYSHQKVTAKRIREDKSHYNTYLNKGIPKHPVSAVSLNAIKAAIFPAKTDYLYFVKNNQTLTHDFSNTYKKHIQNIKTNSKRTSNKPIAQTTTQTKKTNTSKNRSTIVEKSVFDTIKKDEKPAIIKDLWKNVN